MKKNKICSTAVSIIILLSILLVIAPSVNAGIPFQVFGKVYIDDELAGSGVEVKLAFGEDYTDVTDTNGEYQLYIPDDYEGQTGTFYVSFDIYSNLGTEPSTITIDSGEAIDGYLFPLDLDVNTSSVPIDNEPPSKVTGLKVSNAKDGKLKLSWDAATDNVAVDHYNIYRNGSFLTTTTGTTYQDTGLTNNQEYCYQISAVDTSSNEGEKSDEDCATPTKSSSSSGGSGDTTTPPDDEEPEEPTDGGVIPNNPPVMETFTGNETGTQNTNYTYAVLATDNESHDVSYTFDWNDGSNYTTEYFESNTTQEIMHMWTSAGVYKISVFAMDNYPEEGNGSVSNSLYLTVLIDAHIIDDPTNGVDGYLTDDDSDGIYDYFHNDEEGIETEVEYDEVNGTYWIDTDGDGEFDYIYNPDTGTGEPIIEEEPEPKPSGEKEEDNTMYYVAAIVIIIVLLFLFFLATRKKKK